MSEISMGIPKDVTLHKVRVVLEWTDNKTGETVLSQTILFGPFKDYSHTEIGDVYAIRKYRVEFTADRIT